MVCTSQLPKTWREISVQASSFLFDLPPFWIASMWENKKKIFMGKNSVKKIFFNSVKKEFPLFIVQKRIIPYLRNQNKNQILSITKYGFYENLYLSIYLSGTISKLYKLRHFNMNYSISNIVKSEFKLQLCCYINFQTNTLGKDMNLLFPQL